MSAQGKKQRLKLLINGLLALSLCMLLVTICYYYVDRPVAAWVYEHSLSRYPWFKEFAFIPNLLSGLLVFIYLAFIISYALALDSYFMHVLLAVANSVVIASFFKIILKIVFGRYSPLIWINNNPVLFKSSLYGFHFLRKGGAYAAFPSGHTTAIVAAFGVLWLAYPQLRWVWVLPMVAVMVGLVGMNYHFVSDVVAGAFLGALTAYYTVTVSQFTDSK